MALLSGLWVVSHRTEESRTNDSLLCLITHSLVQKRGGLKQGNPAICDVFWRDCAVSGGDV